MNNLYYEMPLSFSGFVNTTAEEHDKSTLPSPSMPPIRFVLRVAANPMRKCGGNEVNKDSSNDRTIPRKIHLPPLMWISMLLMRLLLMPMTTTMMMINLYKPT